MTTRMLVVVLFITLGMLFVMPGLAIAADTSPPSVPAGVGATAGLTSPLIATVTWAPSTDDVGVAGYYVWRSLTTTSTPVRIGEIEASPFDDESGVPGQSYLYSVSAFDAARNTSARSSLSTTVVAGWTQAPHATYSASGRFCRMCHTPHQAATQVSLMRQTSSTPGELSVCYACHDGQGASTNILSGSENSFALASGHTLEAAETDPDATNLCSSCHNVHNDYTQVAGEPSLPRGIINGVTVTGANNTWCLACHEDPTQWYGPGYPSTSNPTRDGDGYPIVGTFPGGVVYEDPGKNAHASIPASGTVRQAGDCLYCHASHRADNAYDGLIENFAPSTPASLVDDQTNGTYAASCFDCHGGELRSEFTTLPVDIKQFATKGGERSGHRIKTPGGNLPVGSPLPCYDCHNPHGSDRGNGELLADTLGQNLNTDTAENVRRTCFSCHSSSDGRIWNSSSSQYVSVGSQEIEGLRRDGQGSPYRILWIPGGVNGHAWDDDESCYQCHGSDYRDLTDDGTGYNVHNPTGGVSPGGIDCYTCHPTYESYMESGGANSTTVYHHVMGTGTGTGDGDTAFADGAYPNGTVALYCMSCHADHDKFNDEQAANLRLSRSSSATTATSDYVTTPTFGICVSCHTNSLAKDPNQKADVVTSANTPKIVGGASGFAGSAHQYPVNSSFGDTTTFSANCSKCHNDEQTKDYQTSPFKFGTHYSASNRLVSALGGTVSNPLAENHCYRCHSLAADGTKSTSGVDWYGAKTMTTVPGTEHVYRQFQLTGSKHPVVATGGNSVECESCHNVHVVTTASKVTDPDNTYTTMAYGTATEQSNYCLRCHDGTLPARTVSGTRYVPYDVTIAPADTSIMNKSVYGTKGHWYANFNGSGAAGQSCALCHDNHGSSYSKLLGAYDSVTGNRINGSAITGNNNTVCLVCHTSASPGFGSTGYTRLTNGYPASGTWPGNAVYTNNPNGIHRGITGGVTQAGITLPAYATAGDCKVCHDVHGTANEYDEVRGTFTSTNFATCLICHDGSPSTRNISQYYPDTAGGSNTSGARRYGHKGSDGGTVADRVLPCYDCHNPHGSSVADGIRVETMDSATNKFVVEMTYNSASASSVRNFCFTCHLPKDTNNGYNGTGYSPVTAGAKVDGFDRINDLKINWSSNPHLQSRTNSCISTGCHANPHYPER